MKVLLDTNIILDIALERKPFYEHVITIFRKLNNNYFDAYITASSITDIYYIVSKNYNKSIAKEFLIDLLDLIMIIGIDSRIVINALHSNIVDFEDAIQSISSEANNMDYIITRNIKDFDNSNVKALIPTDFLNILNIKYG